MRKVILAALVLVFPLACWSADMTPCDLVKGQAKQEVSTLSGRLYFDMHGAYMFSSDCASSPRIYVADPGTESVPPVRFTPSSDNLEKLRPYIRVRGGTAIACGTLTGRLFEKKGFHTRMSGGGPQGNGFGPRGAFRWVLVLQSVGEIHSCGKDPKVP
jgi:hypothetical protein